MRPEPVPIEPTTERGSIHDEVVEVEAAALVGRYQDGETGALEVLHRRLERAIRKLLGRYELAQLPSTVTYQDLTQQGWVVLAAVVPSDLMSAVRRPLASTAAIAASTLSASAPMSNE